MELARKHPDSGLTAADSANSAAILLTGGDPAGVAPELLLQLTADLAHSRAPVLYFATAGTAHIEQFLELCQSLDLRARLGSQPATGSQPTLGSQPATGISVIDVRTAVPETKAFEPRAGQPDARGGRLAFEALRLACDFAVSSPCAGIVTAPLSKEWVARAGRKDFRGHTEYLAERFDREVVMLMHGERFSVIPLTVHIALSEVPAALRARLAEPAVPRLLAEIMERPAYAGQRVAMCGLNPHCGDGGLFGSEDQEFVADWCADVRASGIPLDGPLPADTLFTDGVRERYRLILSCYHDQGLIPFKALEGHAGINATIGLPVPRTSPDHGTAFDIAGRGRASPASLQAAFRAIESGALAAHT